MNNLVSETWYNNRFFDGIWCGDEFDTREDAIEDGVRQYENELNGKGSELFDVDYPEPSGIFCVGKKKEFIPTVNADFIIEQIQEDAYEECGEVAEDYLDWNSCDEDTISELQDAMQKALDDWLDKNNLRPSFYSIVDIEEIDAKDYIEYDDYEPDPYDIDV